MLYKNYHFNYLFQYCYDFLTWYIHYFGIFITIYNRLVRIFLTRHDIIQIGMYLSTYVAICDRC